MSTAAVAKAPFASSAPKARTFQGRVVQLLLAERRLLARLCATALLGALFGLAMPYASRIVLDEALPSSAPRLLLTVALGSLVLLAHRAWMAWLGSATRILLNASIEQSALVGLISALVRSDYSLLKRRNSGWMLTTLESAGTVIRRYVDAFVGLLTQGAFTLAYFAVVANASAAVAGVVVAANALIALVSYGIARLEVNHTRDLLDKTSAQQQYLHSLMSGLTALRALCVGERLGQRWSERMRECGVAQIRCARLGAVLGMVQAVGSQALSTGIMIWAVYRCFDNELTIGQMVFLMSMASGLSGAVTSVIDITVGLRGLRPHVDRVNELLRDAEASKVEPQKPVLTSDFIELKGVSYRYGKNTRWIVSNHDMKIQRGQVLHLSSPSGSGKTTLLRLIAGLITPNQGRITVFGVDACRARELVLYVPQHCKLFEASIQENLSLLSGSSRSEIARVARLTGLDRMLASLPMREETMVAADGQNLSSGQRQLIVLTAAFASKRPVILLDEATSQIDAQTRAACDWAALFAGKTVIRVEHG